MYCTVPALEVNRCADFVAQICSGDHTKELLQLFGYVCCVA